MRAATKTRQCLTFVIFASTLLCCSLGLRPASSQCQSDADCIRRGAGFETTRCVEHTCEVLPVVLMPEGGDGDAKPTDRYYCLGQSAPVTPDTTRRMKLSQKFLNRDTGKPITAADALIRLCNASDVSCVNPRQTVLPNEEGIAVVDVEYGFNGYFEVTGPGLQSSIRTLDPVIADREGRPFQIFANGTAALLAQVLYGGSVKYEPTLAHAIVGIFDCFGVFASGASFTASPLDGQGRSRTFYSDGTVPLPDATETNEGGQGGFLNLPPGFGKFSIVDNASGRKVAESVVPLRPDFVTYAVLTTR